MAVAAKNIPAPDLVPVRRALLSVSDKTGLIDFAAALAKAGVELISTGGTAKSIAAAGIAVRDVSELTGFPEIMDGRVKTLHPSVHGALLGVRDDPEHAAAMREHGIEPIDLVVVNLYPFEEVRASGAAYTAVVENIDIGGPAMVRASAKNHAYVAIVTEPEDYAAVLETLAANGGALPLDFRKRLAAKAFARTAAYDAAISGWFAEELKIEQPSWRAFGGRLHSVMRYGENPHQSAGFYVNGDKRPGVATARQLQGKQLSYNNINDTDAAYELVGEFDPARTAAVAIIKHANPCGVAEGASLREAYLKALACDPVSAFGGIVALNRLLDAEAAEEIVKTFTEVIIAPEASEAAAAIVAAKKNLRLLVTGGLPDPRQAGIMVKSVAGGLLVQGRDNAVVDDLDLKVVTRRAPTEAEMADLKFAFRIAKHVKSNAIVYAKDRATVGVGAGQMSRVDSSRIAARKALDAAEAAGHAEPLTRGSVVASDAFFPFADGLLAAVEAGATAVIQPGGSMRDEDVIKAADEHGIAMVFTGIRHFRH
ncbi:MULTISPECIES: bifunctional phosphoribosylaminoimidazolecarboxamide formyltransferase/IMP cyclohydrolase [Phyllobacteriaceae]|jgi:phosphoribosylaminoimidazolecarboxamide formyltransferase/IMP cyclohydrolase|uniref:Bifunctional purine biosynthesis protein PurH n=1 Tax=Mesorhizobium hungaricum TaxID=1566387 RepID=A0A1C2DEY6_9HYPH|nr:MULTISPECIES: bifunctional phosphoribosylaminoimidazolecarboxamide formyltransferase/IMP cyclohydrolase [Mesorhizobium]MBN9232574.1 bifunctional phosphoribosylaminoimidazolecarboxamide formyltransferase/IMP cyclohydrolase [Mesorhizobium sp.]MDQ0330171.1 phosphoribosylaminoimidazolecarboxamide formyltransferase/IMP cyclohydrolase [Mesorhizobium sp. YL-MeA3-2017]OCX13300.1 bifunctional phosphoribosylaminoimidazolecarboxamide formyltransferase/IMP cyclohydrolase [Mesorhizobium hungaricum]